MRIYYEPDLCRRPWVERLPTKAGKCCEEALFWTILSLAELEPFFSFSAFETVFFKLQGEFACMYI